MTNIFNANRLAFQARDGVSVSDEFLIHDADLNLYRCGVDAWDLAGCAVCGDPKTIGGGSNCYAENCKVLYARLCPSCVEKNGKKMPDNARRKTILDLSEGRDAQEKAVSLVDGAAWYFQTAYLRGGRVARRLTANEVAAIESEHGYSSRSIRDAMAAIYSVSKIKDWLIEMRIVPFLWREEEADCVFLFGPAIDEAYELDLIAEGEESRLATSRGAGEKTARHFAAKYPQGVPSTGARYDEE